MLFSRIVGFGILLAGVLAARAQETASPSHLPIAVPKDASVDFEVDAPGKELMPLIRHYFGDDTDAAKITVKTGAGDVKLKASDIEAMLKQVRELHVVSYSGSKAPELLSFHEAKFATEGMHRVAKIGGAQEMLVMVRRRSQGQYAMVLRHGDQVTVVRTEGVPDLGELTQVLLQGLAGVAQDAIRAKVGHKVLGL